MPFSYSEATGDGATTVFPFAFSGSGSGYIRPEDIHVIVNGVEDYIFTLSGPNQVQLAVAPPAPAEAGVPNIMIRRIVPKDVPYSDFSRGNNFGQSQLNNTALQQLYALHEFLDGFLPDGYFVKGDMDFKGQKIVNLGSPTLPGDAVPLSYLTDDLPALTQGATVSAGVAIAAASESASYAAEAAGSAVASATSAESVSVNDYTKTHRLADVIQKGPWVDARSFATLEAADNFAVAQGRELLISSQWDICPSTLSAYVKVILGGAFNNEAALAFTGGFESGNFQCFMGAGTITFGVCVVDFVRPEWWCNNTLPGTTDMTDALYAAVHCGVKRVHINGVIGVAGVEYTGKAGLIIEGDGAGDFYGLGAVSVLKYIGVDGGSLLINKNSNGLIIKDIQFDGNSKRGRALWFLNDYSGGCNDMINLNNLVFKDCTQGIYIGSNPEGGPPANYNEIFGLGLVFLRCSTPIAITANQMEFFTLRNCMFTDSNAYHIHATAGVPIGLEHVYFQNLDPTNGIAAVYGPIIPMWNDVWSELGDFPVLVATSKGDSQFGLLTNCHFTNPGTASDKTSIVWNGGPLTISSSYVAGKVVYDRRQPNASIEFKGSRFKPAPFWTASSSAPIITGTYSGTVSPYTIEVVVGGYAGTATYKWKKGSGAFSSAIVSSDKSPLELGLYANFAPGNLFTPGDSYTFTAEPCGIYEATGLYVNQPRDVDFVYNFQGAINTFIPVAYIIANSTLGTFGGYCELVFSFYDSVTSGNSAVFSFRYNKAVGGNWIITPVTVSVPVGVTIQAVDMADGKTLKIEFKDAIAGSTYVSDASLKIRNVLSANDLTVGVAVRNHL